MMVLDPATVVDTQSGLVIQHPCSLPTCLGHAVAISDTQARSINKVGRMCRSGYLGVPRHTEMILTSRQIF